MKSLTFAAENQNKRTMMNSKMILPVLRSAWRDLMKYKSQNLISVFCLSVGMVCFCVTLLFLDSSWRVGSRWFAGNDERLTWVNLHEKQDSTMSGIVYFTPDLLKLLADSRLSCIRFIEPDRDLYTGHTVLTDTDGKKCDKIVWECSCLQKKCGACAMVINGRPQLACGAVLAEQKTDVITVEPLRKFPVIADLMVDRDKMMDNLRTLQLWLNGDAQAAVKKNDLLYEASGCLQCGCCLEVCPNFCTEGDFYGMAALVPASRLLEEMSREESRALRKNYSKNIYNGCGKSLACRNICPAGLDIDALMVNSNAALLWKMWRPRKSTASNFAPIWPILSGLLSCSVP